MTTHPFQYQLTAPFSMTLQPDSTGSFQVVNSGTKPLAVHESTGRYSPRALKYPAADHATTVTTGTPWITVAGPATFVLQPGEARTVHITSHVPADAQGTHYLDLIWTASPVHTSAAAGPLHLAGAVATTVGIPEPGVAVAAPGPAHLPRAVSAPHHGGLSGLDMGGAALAVLLPAAAAAAWLRRRSRRAGRRAA